MQDTQILAPVSDTITLEQKRQELIDTRVIDSFDVDLYNQLNQLLKFKAQGNPTLEEMEIEVGKFIEYFTSKSLNLESNEFINRILKRLQLKSFSKDEILKLLNGDNPIKFIEESFRIKKTLSSGKLDVAMILGTTNKEPNPRLNEEFLSQLGDGNVIHNPQVKNWNSAFSSIEADMMSNASVLGIRIETGMENGSLGSLAEIPMAIVSALMRGQKVEISFGEGYSDTLTERGAQVQYEILIAAIEEIKKNNPALFNENDGYISVVNNENLEDFGKRINLALERQRDNNSLVAPFIKASEVKKRTLVRILVTDHLGVAIAGSGAASFKQDQGELTKNRALISQGLSKEGVRINDFEEGETAAAFNRAYSLNDEKSIKEALFIQADELAGVKVIVNPVDKGILSKGATLEVGINILNTLLEGPISIQMLEKFDLPNFMYKKILDIWEKVKSNPDFEELDKDGTNIESLDIQVKYRLLRSFLEINDSISLEGLDINIVNKALSAIQKIIKGKATSLDLKDFKGLERFGSFAAGDNAKRVRQLVIDHLKRIQEEFGEDLCLIANNYNEAGDKLKTIALLREKHSEMQELRTVNNEALVKQADLLSKKDKMGSENPLAATKQVSVVNFSAIDLGVQQAKLLELQATIDELLIKLGFTSEDYREIMETINKINKHKSSENNNTGD